MILAPSEPHSVMRRARQESAKAAGVPKRIVHHVIRPPGDATDVDALAAAWEADRQAVMEAMRQGQ